MLKKSQNIVFISNLFIWQTVKEFEHEMFYNNPRKFDTLRRNSTDFSKKSFCPNVVKQN